jgi:hypothetical protein
VIIVHTSKFDATNSWIFPLEGVSFQVKLMLRIPSKVDVK